MPQRKAGQIISLPGVMTGLATQVNRHLKQFRVAPRVTVFLRQLEDMTFPKSGFQDGAGYENPGLWCMFDLGAWIRETQLSKNAVCHIRAQLVVDNIIWYDPDPELPGRGRIGWNVKFEEWKPLQEPPPTWGGFRERAGRPPKRIQVDNGRLPEINQDNNASLTKEEFKMTTPANLTEFKLTMDACSNGAQAEVSSSPLRKGSRKKRVTSTSNDVPQPAKPARASPSSAKYQEPEWLAINEIGFALLWDLHGKDGFNAKQQAGILRRMFEKLRLRDPPELRACWEAVRLDPFFDEVALTMEFIEKRLPVFRRSPAGYLKNMQTKRADKDRRSSNGKTTATFARRSATAPIQAVDHFSPRDDDIP